jgi:DNA-binding transcriptional regulator YdaS (Cro superfamily)
MSAREIALKIAIRRAGGQRALARKLGITHQSITQWLEKDTVPSRWLEPIRKATGVPPHRLRPDLYRDYRDVKEQKELELA